MNNVYEIIRRPIVTEKTAAAEDANKYAFEVSLSANKHQIRSAVETLFDVRVVGVNTAIMQGKRKRFGRVFGKRSNWKKAVVTLAEGDTIEFYQGDEEMVD